MKVIGLILRTPYILLLFYRIVVNWICFASIVVFQVCLHSIYCCLCFCQFMAILSCNKC